MSAVSRDSPMSACLTHVGNSWRRPDDLQYQHLAADPYHVGLSGDAYWTPSICFLLGPFPVCGNVTQCEAAHLNAPLSIPVDMCFNTVAVTKGCDIYKAQSSHVRSYPHEYFSTFPALLEVLTYPDSIMRCKWNSVNLQAAPELQADPHPPVKEDNN